MWVLSVMTRLPGMSLIVVAVLGLVACTSAGNSNQVTPTGREPLITPSEPTAITPAEAIVAVVPQQEAGVEVATWDDISAGVARLPNYRRQMVLRFEGDPRVETPGSWQMESDFMVSENPTARVLDISYVGDQVVGEFQSMTTGQKNGEFFLYIPTIGCISTSEQNYVHMSSGIVDPEYFLGGWVAGPLISSGEVVHDQPALRIDLDRQSLPRFVDQDVAVNGHFYIAEDDDQPLQLALEISGVADFAATGRIQDGTLYVEINWYETSDASGVNLPADCRQSDVYPLPEGSFDITTLDDLVGYRTLLSIVELVAFYQAEMGAAGWDAVEEPTVLDDAAFMTFSRGGQEIIINIEARPETEEVSVIISP